MHVYFIGHSCFYIASRNGTRIITDPYHPTALGIDRPQLEIDVVLASHDHFDHFNLSNISGSPDVVLSPSAPEKAKDVKVRGVSCYHDLREGLYRGENTMMIFEVDGITICHCGDLGHTLSDEKIAEVGKIDVLMIPVGGNFSLNAAMANKVVEQLEPPYVLPMHYDVLGLRMPLGTIKKFLRGKRQIRKADPFTLDEAPRGFKEREIVVLPRRLSAAGMIGQPEA
ncbi:MAG: MBL fold metallo-hydrolase [Planctomycetes bacterium]|nr:MBL fold metallo-hydrolase [Planctomycetota bacterium]